MISQKNRFHGHSSLKYLYNKGKTSRTPYFGVRFVRNKQREEYRLAVVVSKKVAKSAVTRNKIRRRLYEAVRKNLPEDFKGVDMAIIVYDERVASAEHQQIEDMLLPILRSISKA